MFTDILAIKIYLKHELIYDTTYGNFHTALMSNTTFVASVVQNNNPSNKCQYSFYVLLLFAKKVRTIFETNI